MHFHVITIFPGVVRAYTDAALLGRAQKEKKISVSCYDPRDFTKDKWRKIDDRPYGGGPGMVMEAEPIMSAVKKARGKKQKVKTVIVSPRGAQFSNEMAEKWAKKYDHVVIISGRYEGIDARVKKALRAEEISMGPYVLTGGEVPAMALIDATARRIPGVLGNEESPEEYRVASGETYTRPEAFTYEGKTYRVPKVLLSGDHKAIEEWRRRNGER
ncbi:MAG: tRNA (guanosine(37)-N1)-methyltransferase TrmD [Parcubacteria group bacterium]|nr:tRNA (guanosine(37)-N1)-methyltransferase TrmD [Parcubacteria group bacterium]